MATIKKRLGVSVFATVLSLTTVMLLLMRSNVHTQLTKIGLSSGILGWGKKEGEVKNGEGARVVVFGDSWVDGTAVEGEEGRGRSWPRVLCDEINCSSYLNFAVSQPSSEYPEQPPTGALTSNSIYLANSKTNPEETTEETLLPDLTTQIQSYIALPTSAQETYFIISLGFWDIYQFASLDYTIARNATDNSINELFTQIDILYTHISSSLKETNPSTTNASTPLFQLIIPKILDPSLLPGWLSQRPLPLAPSSIAEHQKAAAYLTERWNQGIQNRLTQWMKSPSEIEIETETPKSESNAREDVRRVPHTSGEEVLKDVIYYDFAGHLLDVMIEHHLEDEGLSDASGLGKGESPYESVGRPCVCEAVEDEDVAGLVELGNGMIVCGSPEEMLWWDGWGVGSRAKEVAGKEVAGMIEEGRSERGRLGMGYGNHVGGVRN